MHGKLQFVLPICETHFPFQLWCEVHGKGRKVPECFLRLFRWREAWGQEARGTTRNLREDAPCSPYLSGGNFSPSFRWTPGVSTERRTLGKERNRECGQWHQSVSSPVCSRIRQGSTLQFWFDIVIFLPLLINAQYLGDISDHSQRFFLNKWFKPTLVPLCSSLVPKIARRYLLCPFSVEIRGLSELTECEPPRLLVLRQLAIWENWPRRIIYILNI